MVSTLCDVSAASTAKNFHLTANSTSEEHATVTSRILFLLLFITDKLGNLTLILGSVGTMASKLM